ncbi:hypothetical protein ACIQI8_27190 [Streptomyces sp. NPDC092369]|uniref:hypothetical protein n=1 Tax=Streptomyces sp. NPDC092369 TaxID=3366015 RepID=UPI0038058FAB
MKTADWPYDADQHDPLTQLRIPVTGTHPGFTYTACFDRDSEARPNDAEAQQIASFIEEYQEHYFGNGSWRRVQQAKPFDMDCYTTTVFHKWAPNDWSYRCVTWQYGPFWVPVFPRQRGGEYDEQQLGALTLVQVMDRIHAHGGDQPSTRWAAWKTSHPEAFRPPRTNTPDRQTINDEGRAVTTLRIKRACNGCGLYLGDADNRDVDEHGNLTDVRAECAICAPLVEFEAQGCATWQVTPRSISQVGDELDRLGVYAKGYWEDVDGKLAVTGLRVGTGATRVVAKYGDWLVRHPDGQFAVHPAPAVASSV